MAARKSADVPLCLPPMIKRFDFFLLFPRVPRLGRGFRHCGRRWFALRLLVTIRCRRLLLLRLVVPIGLRRLMLRLLIRGLLVTIRASSALGRSRLRLLLTHGLVTTVWLGFALGRVPIRFRRVAGGVFCCRLVMPAFIGLVLGRPAVLLRVMVTQCRVVPHWMFASLTHLAF